MKKKVLFFGNIHHSEAPFIADLLASDEFDILPVVDEVDMTYSNLFDKEQSPFACFMRRFKPEVLRVGEPAIRKIADLMNTYKPYCVLVRCWTKFETFRVPNAVYWKVESKQRNYPHDPVVPIVPPVSGVIPKAFLTQALSEVLFYKTIFPDIPVGYFPRGVSHQWEKPQKKTMEVMTTGTTRILRKIDSYETLVKPLCENLSAESVNVFVHLGRENIEEWAKDNLRGVYDGDAAPKLYGSAKIFICPVAFRFDKDLVSHKTIQVMACRTLVVMQRYGDIENVFGLDGENLIYADTPEECLDKVQYYLAHDREREKIAKRGYEFIHSEYNYTKLFKRALGHVGL